MNVRSSHAFVTMATPTFSDFLPTFELTWSCAQVKLYIWYLSQLVMTASYTPQTLYDCALCITAKHFWSMLPWAMCCPAHSSALMLRCGLVPIHICYLVCVLLIVSLCCGIDIYTCTPGVCNQALT